MDFARIHLARLEQRTRWILYYHPYISGGFHNHIHFADRLLLHLLVLHICRRYRLSFHWVMDVSWLVLQQLMAVYLYTIPHFLGFLGSTIWHNLDITSAYVVDHRRLCGASSLSNIRFRTRCFLRRNERFDLARWPRCLSCDELERYKQQYHVWFAVCVDFWHPILVSFLLAGHSTTDLTITWTWNYCWHYLCRILCPRRFTSKYLIKCCRSRLKIRDLSTK